MTTAHKIFPVIICGGRGSRLWPISSDRATKPFLSLTSSRSLLKETAERVSERLGERRFGPLTAIGSIRHEELLRRELPEAGLVLEPQPRDSAPAVAAACLGRDPEDLILILPADHHIGDVDAFHRAIAVGAEAARGGVIVTFGVKPHRPETGYGYIKAPGANMDTPAAIEAFVEKPNEALAEAYLAEGGYWWNAGIFIFTVGRMTEAFRSHAPEILECVGAAAGGALPPRPGETVRLDVSYFAKCRSQSIDYAVMEKVGSVKVIPVDMKWSDIGDYYALHSLKASPGQNVCEGPVFVHDSKNCYVRSEGPMIAVRGLTGVAVAATSRGVLVTPLAEASSTKPLAEEAASRGFAASLHPGTISRVRRWLFGHCLPFWAERAWDSRRGGFVEAIALDGTPLAGLERRGRILPRQIYAFSHARILGWEDSRGLELVQKGLAYLDTTARSPLGGWASGLTSSGEPLNEVRTLYDHAFIVLAGAYAFMATGTKQAQDIAVEALDFIESQFADTFRGGFASSAPAGNLRHSNPHMHLLEACLALHRSTGEARALALATDIVELFETRFFDPISGALTEAFAPDWSRASGAAGDRVEPGHCYEWAVLLSLYEDQSGRDLISWRRRLIKFADRVGRGRDGFAVDAIDREGAVSSGGRRLWPQLEMFRARLFHPETGAPGDASTILERILDDYFDGGLSGGWTDSFNSLGRPNAKFIPASMLYHILTAFSPLFGFDNYD